MTELNIELDDVLTTFSIPTAWDEVTVKQYQQVMDVNLSGMTDIDIVVARLSILGDIDKELLYLMPVEAFNEVVELLKFTTQPITTEMKDSIQVGGIEYHLKKDFNNLIISEITAIEMIIKDAGGNFDKCIDKLLCVYLRQKKDNGKLEAFRSSFMKRQYEFQTIMISDVYQMFLFFSSGKTS